MPYSYVSYRGGDAGVPSGTTGPFAFGSIGFLDATTVSIADALKVYVGGVLLDATDYTLNTVTKELTLVNGYSTGLGAGVYLKIQRSTKIDDRYVDYADSSNLTEQVLDLDSDQNFFLVQEATDGLDDCLKKGVDGNWNAEGLVMKSLAEGTDGTDAVNVNQLYSAIGGGTSALIQGQTSIAFTADGTGNTYTIPGRAGKDVDDNNIYRNGIKLVPTDAYTVADSGEDLVVTLVTTPETGEIIEAVYGTGTAIGELGPDSVGAPNLQDDIVSPEHINGGNTPAGTNHYLKSVGDAVSWASLTADQINDFDTAVNTRPLSSFSAATGNVSMGSQRITNIGTGVNQTDAATVGQLDGLLPLANNNGSFTTYSGSNNPVNLPALGTLFGITIRFPGQGQGNGQAGSDAVDSYHLPGNASNRYIVCLFSYRDFNNNDGEHYGFNKGGVYTGNTNMAAGGLFPVTGSGIHGFAIRIA